MGDLRLRPDERVELALRPAVASRLGRYALALLPALWGAALAFLLRGPGWDRLPDPWDQLLPPLVMLAGLIPVAGSCWLLGRRRMGVLVLALGVLVAAGSLAIPGPPATSVPLSLAGATLLLLVYVDWRRRRTVYHVTSLRIVTPSGEVLHSELRDLDARQGTWGRWIDMGTLVPVTRADEPAARFPPATLHGIRPFRRVRHAVELLVRQSTATPYLRAELELDTKVSHAMAALHRR